MTGKPESGWARAERDIILKVDRPMTYAEIEKATGRKQGFTLAIALAQMVAGKRMFYREGRPFSAAWPVYSTLPIPKNFVMAARTEYGMKQIS